MVLYCGLFVHKRGNSSKTPLAHSNCSGSAFIGELEDCHYSYYKASFKYEYLIDCVVTAT